MIADRPHNPIVPGNVKDRTGAAGILRRAGAEIRKRWAGLEADILAAFDRIQILTINEDAKTLYQLTPEQLQALSLELQAALARWIADERDPAHIAWWSAYEQEASQLGAAQSVANLTQLSASYAATRALETVIFSTPYKNRLAMAMIKSQDHWKSLAAKQRADLTAIIGRAVVDGKNPRAVRKEIQETLEVGKSRAMLYAQTEVTGVLREARWAEADYAREEMGINTGLLWTSALLPTTRAWHASRNGKVYTSDQVREFYAQGGNRYNCYLPGTRVAGRFVAGSKASYEGPAVELVTAGGRHLSVTANHPVMTDRGLVAAGELREGDHLVAYGGQVEHPVGVIDLHDQQVNPLIEDVFAALVDVGHQLAGRVGAVDFHGDAVFMQPDIHVVRADRVLAFGCDPKLVQVFDRLALEHTDATATTGRPPDLFLVPHGFAASGGVSGGGMLLADFRRSGGHPDALGFTHAALPMSGTLDPSRNALSAHADAFADRQDGFAGSVGREHLLGQAHPLSAPVLHVPEPGAVHGLHDGAIAAADAPRDVLQGLAGLAAFDELVHVRRFQYSGHVFDLQELSGLMLGSGIVASNCHCSQTECLLDADGKPILTKSLQSKMANERARWNSLYGKD